MTNQLTHLDRLESKSVHIIHKPTAALRIYACCGQ